MKLSFRLLSVLLLIHFTSICNSTTNRHLIPRINILDSINHYESLLISNKNKTEQLKNMSRLGDLYYLNGQLDSAISVRQKLVDVSYELEQYDYTIANGIQLVQNLYTVGELYKSIQIAYWLDDILKSNDLKNSYQLSLNNTIGNNLKRQKAWQKAISYYYLNVNFYKDGNVPDFDRNAISKAMQYERDPEYILLSFAYMNLGICYLNTNKLDSAIYCSQQSDKLMIKMGLKYRASSLSVISKAYLKLGVMDSAGYYGRLSVKIGLNEGDKLREICDAYDALSKYYFGSNKLDSAIIIARKLAQKGRVIPVIIAEKNGYETLYKSYDKLNMIDSAYFYLQKFESVQQDMVQKASIIEARNLDAIKKAQADSIQFAHEKEITRLNHQQQIQSQKQQKIFFLFGLLALSIFMIILIWRFRITARQRNIIRQQKIEVETAKQTLEAINLEITDSINYAKRIQNAILPSTKVIKENLPDSFIVYKPRDIVSGDFYWLNQKDNTVLFAAADCTGHGVPGAIVGVICNNGLNRSVQEYGLSEPGQILDSTRNIILKEFEKSDKVIMDGMDIALCALNRNTLQYAGAYNPLWIVRNGELIETKADRQPVGKFVKEKPFVTHTMDLQKGDVIYLFSDGFPDQFGGDSSKKYKSGRFKKFLVSIHTETMQKQKERIEKEFNDWKGYLEQIDDVCIIGVRI